ncbi:hypothetical protein [Mycobacterium marseillense]|uniref:hypothetical protein n=1 Tax=Mycobacterium marseillense TaxID=701042 RepID=UPI001FC9ED8A|nr:hypothetical protein [Mycobacterium marseillense]
MTMPVPGLRNPRTTTLHRPTLTMTMPVPGLRNPRTTTLHRPTLTMTMPVPGLRVRPCSEVSFADRARG